MHAVTGKPIKLMGVGEKPEELESFQASRFAGRILGQGDIVSLVEKAADVIEKEDAEKLAEKMLKGQFTLNDMADQLKQVRSMGDVGGLMGLIPGLSKMKKQISEANLDDKLIVRQQAILSSMTPVERERPKILNGSRRRRIANGSGTTVQDVNRLMKQHKQMGQMMKKMGKRGRKGLIGGEMPPGLLPRI
jgi:signal recognition particle subunit SRP54